MICLLIMFCFTVSDEFKLIRQSVIDMVMATEMKQHFEHLAKFDNNFNKRHSSHEENLSTVSLFTYLL